MTASTRALSGPAIALALLGSVLSGCGLSDEAPAPTPRSTPNAPEPSVTRPADPSATATPADQPTTAPSSAPGGSGDSEKNDQPATAGGGICSNLEAADVGATLGGTVRGAGLAPAGCEFNQADRSAPSATFVETSFASTPGGMAGAQDNATASVEGDPQDLPGIGTAAFVVTGTVFGGEDIQGAGAVRIGDRLIQVTLGQRAGLSRAKVKALVVDLLELAVARAS